MKHSPPWWMGHQGIGSPVASWCWVATLATVARADLWNSSMESGRWDGEVGATTSWTWHKMYGKSPPNRGFWLKSATNTYNRQIWLIVPSWKLGGVTPCVICLLFVIVVFDLRPHFPGVTPGGRLPPCRSVLRDTPKLWQCYMMWKLMKNHQIWLPYFTLFSEKTRWIWMVQT